MEGNNGQTGQAAPPSPIETAEAAIKGQENVTPQGEGQQGQAKEKLLRKLKLKVDGQEIEEEIDLNDDETLKRHLQMSKASQKRMSEAAQTKRQAEEFVRQLKADPVRLLQSPELGVDFKRIAEEYLAKQLEMEMLSPEQRKLKEYEEKLREYEDGKRREQEESHSKQLADLQQRYADDYDKRISEALSSSGLPKTPKTVKRMAQLMHKNLEYGFELEPKQLVDLVREEYLSEIKELFGSTDGDSMLKLLGDDVANKIRRADLARLKTAKPDFSKRGESAPQAEPQPSKRQTIDEWKEEVARRARS